MADLRNAQLFQMAISKKRENSPGNVVRAKRFGVLPKAGIAEVLNHFVNAPIGVIGHRTNDFNGSIYAVKKSTGIGGGSRVVGRK
jgi:hypothetical protein